MSWRTEQLSDSVTLHCGDCREILPTLGKVDHIITDPPYSERTHAGHDSVARGARDGAVREPLGYAALTPTMVRGLVGDFARACDGWICWMTDHSLAPAIQRELEERGRYVFAPLPFFQPGRSVRMTGDGPCSWTDWIIAARTAAQHRWGTLPGGYVATEGWADKRRMGGKPTRLMSLLVQHYSRSGELVCDPFLGGGTTGVACVMEGRRFVGIEIDVPTFDNACRRIADELKRPRLDLAPAPPPAEQMPLGLGGEA